MTDDKYPVLRATEKAKDVLFCGEKVTIVDRKQPKAASIAATKGTAPADKDLYNALSALRYKIANLEGVPAFVVFSNATLLDMAAKQPVIRPEFLQVSGVGDRKAERYGEAFMQCIRQWRKTHS